MVLRKARIFVSIGLILITGSAIAETTPSKMQVCVGKGGALTVAPRCSRGTVPARLSRLSSGDRGRCQHRIAANRTTNGTAIATAQCPDGYVVTEHGYSTYRPDGGFALTHPVREELIFNNPTSPFDGDPWGVSVTTQTQVGTPDEFNQYELFVDVVCCPL